METNFDNQKIIPVELTKEMKKSYIDYAMSVIVGRALPDVRDGLKPVHRRILYTMHESGLTADKPHRKCATTVGDVLGKYHPHGDQSVYDALVRLAQDFSLRYMLVDGHGNFGSVDGDPPAAYRYTESRMSKICQFMLRDIDKETVDWQPNYDDRLEEPQVLPSRFPNLLVNGSSGIAVGMATNIPPHNLCEVIEGIDALIDNPELTIDDLMQYIKGPDFPTSGIIVGRSGIVSAYHTGRGKITLRAKAEIETDAKGKSKIVVTELPYQVNKVRLQEHISELVKDKRLEGISAMNDYSDRDGMNLVIEVKRDANPNVVLNHLYKLTQLQDTVGIINLALHHGQPKVMDLKTILKAYVEFQKEVITRRTIFDKKKAEARAHILEGFRIALDHIDEVIKTIRESYDDAKANLMARFGFSEIQAQSILDMQLKRLQGLEREKIDEEYDKLMKMIAYFNELLADEAKILGVLKDELNEIKEKYGDARRTEIIAADNDIIDEDLIPQEDCVITLTHFGYIKRTPVAEYKAQHRGGRGVSGLATREEDFVEQMFTGSSHSTVIIFTSLGRYYKMRAFEIAASGRNSKGTAIVNLLELGNEEKVAAMVMVDMDVVDKKDEYNLTMVTKKGTVKKTTLGEYLGSNRKGGTKGIVLDDDDSLIQVELTKDDADVLIVTHNGVGIRFSETDVRACGRVSRGVRGIKLKGDDYVIGMAIVHEKTGDELLVISENGFGKRTPFDEYKTQNRGGMGMRTYKISEQTGKVAKILATTETDDILLITNEGVIIRTDAAEIRNVGRVSKGVRLVRLADGVQVVDAAKAEKVDEAEIEPTDDANEGEAPNNVEE